MGERQLRMPSLRPKPSPSKKSQEAAEARASVKTESSPNVPRCLQAAPAFGEQSRDFDEFAISLHQPEDCMNEGFAVLGSSVDTEICSGHASPSNTDGGFEEEEMMMSFFSRSSSDLEGGIGGFEVASPSMIGSEASADLVENMALDGARPLSASNEVDNGDGWKKWTPQAQLQLPQQALPVNPAEPRANGNAALQQHSLSVVTPMVTANPIVPLHLASVPATSLVPSQVQDNTSSCIQQSISLIQQSLSSSGSQSTGVFTPSKRPRSPCGSGSEEGTQTPTEDYVPPVVVDRNWHVEGAHSYKRSKAHKGRGIEQDYICGYCRRRKTSASACADGRVRIRCECGGQHADNKPRMHATWSPVTPNTAPKPVKREPKPKVPKASKRNQAAVLNTMVPTIAQQRTWVFVDVYPSEARGNPVYC